MRCANHHGTPAMERQVGTSGAAAGIHGAFLAGIQLTDTIRLFLPFSVSAPGVDLGTQSHW